MNIITEYSRLEGKTIAFAHMAQFADKITLATKEGDVLMATFDFYDDGEENEIRILEPPFVMEAIENDRYLRRELGERGIFDLEAYKEKVRKQREEQKKRAEEEAKKRELKELERLKAKYEGGASE